MSTKRALRAAAIAATISMSALTLSSGPAFAAPGGPTPPPCPNCNGGPAPGGGAPGHEQQAPQSHEPPQAPQSSAPQSPQSHEPQSPQSSAPQSPQSSEPPSATIQCTAEPAIQRATEQPRPRTRLAERNATERPEFCSVERAGLAPIERAEQKAAGGAVDAAPAPALHTARCVPQRECGRGRPDGCARRLQHRGPRRTPTAAGARARLE